MNSIATLLIEELKKKMGDNYFIRYNEVMKGNGVKKASILISEPDSNISPTIYIDELIGDIAAWRKTIEQGVNEIYSMYMNNKELPPEVTKVNDLSKEEILKNTKPQLVNTKRNQEILNDVPSVEFLDLSIIFRSHIGEINKNIMSFILTNDFCEEYDITLDDLMKTIGTLNDDVVIKTLFEELQEMMQVAVPEPNPDEPEMWVLTNKKKFYGAAYILNPEVLRMAREKIGGNFFIIPSSIHECLLIKDTEIVDPDFLKATISEVNNTQVLPEEILSYNLYYYNTYTQRVEIVK